MAILLLKYILKINNAELSHLPIKESKNWERSFQSHSCFGIISVCYPWGSTEASINYHLHPMVRWSMRLMQVPGIGREKKKLLG